MHSPSGDAEPARQCLAAIVESSDDAIISKSLDGTITSWNRAAQRMFGYTAEEAIGRSIRIIIPVTRQSEEDDVLSQLRRGEAVEHFETIRQRRDGTLFPVSLTSSPIRNSQGEVIGASKIVRDMSGPKRVEATLAAAQAAQADLGRRLRVLGTAPGALLTSPCLQDVRSATMGLAAGLLPADSYVLWEFDVLAGIWKAAACRGVSAEFIERMAPALGESGALRDAVVAADVQAASPLAHVAEACGREGIVSLLAMPLTIGGEYVGTFMFCYRDRHDFTDVESQTAAAFGNMASVALRTADLYDEQSRRHDQASFLAKASATLAMSLDYEDTLKQLASLAVPAIADWCAVYLVNEGGQIERLAMAHPDQVKHGLALQLEAQYPSHPDSPHSVASAVRSGRPSLISHVTDDTIARAARGDRERGSRARALGLTSYICVPLRARGRTLGALAFASMQPARQFGQADLQFAEDLAARAALAIDNAQVYDEVRRANQLKDDFLATLSHELRTPLNAMVGYARMLEKGVIPPERQEAAVKIVNRNAIALTRLVEDVLDVSRIVSGRVRLEVKPVDMSAVLDDAVGAIRLAAEAKGISMELAIDPRAGLVWGDRDRLRQIVWNLLSNAAKFTRKGGRIKVRLERAPSHVEVIVSDTGIGLAASFIPHVFERFRQADSRFSREHGGLGLGLAISRHLVEMHGGTIVAESDGEGRGATFRVRLPAVANARAAS